MSLDICAAETLPSPSLTAAEQRWRIRMRKEPKLAVFFFFFLINYGINRQYIFTGHISLVILRRTYRTEPFHTLYIHLLCLLRLHSGSQGCAAAYSSRHRATAGSTTLQGCMYLFSLLYSCLPGVSKHRRMQLRQSRKNMGRRSRSMRSV